ncbi:endothelial cell-specific chemotaxis regulator isoform X4 [Manis javanica]|uniref:endothelial cell-specific chemotaxis regulator isoform X4 n=1 Tax=Manis javanica TaxID=9974 RepID=UPI00187A6178|nr:endothelial cell-specific chemotaxis regulator isoform X4 [Manis javanica]
MDRATAGPLPPLAGAAAMGTGRAVQLCWAILGFLLLRGDRLSSEPSSPSPLPNASTPATMSLRTREDPAILPSPTSETVLTVAAFGVISFIAILVVVVIVLVSVVSLRFKCRKNKESEDPQKPGSSGVSESCSTANGEKDSITLISMKNINMNNSKGCPTAEKVL